MTSIGDKLHNFFIRPPKPLPCHAISNERIDKAVKDVEEAARELRHTSRNETLVAASAAIKILETSRR